MQQKRKMLKIENKQQFQCKNHANVLEPRFSLGAIKKDFKDYKKCKKCGKKIRISDKTPSYMACPTQECNFSICRRCIPEFVEEEDPFDDSLGQAYRKKDRSVDEVFFETEVKKGRVLNKIFLHPSELRAEDRDEFTQFIVCGEYVCWRGTNDLKIKILNIKEITQSRKSPLAFVEGKNLKVIDLAQFFDKTTIMMSGARLNISMEPCSPLFALHSCSDEKFSEEQIIQRSN